MKGVMDKGRRRRRRSGEKKEVTTSTGTETGKKNYQQWRQRLAKGRKTRGWKEREERVSKPNVKQCKIQTRQTRKKRSHLDIINNTRNDK